MTNTAIKTLAPGLPAHGLAIPKIIPAFFSKDVSSSILSEETSSDKETGTTPVREQKEGILYTIGYANPDDAQRVAQLMQTEQILLIDIRSEPRSRWYPQWTCKALAIAYGQRYIWEPRLGNRNRKNREAGIELEEGHTEAIQDAAFLLSQGVSLILVCACKYRQECHRRLVDKLIHQALNTLQGRQPFTYISQTIPFPMMDGSTSKRECIVAEKIGLGYRTEESGGTYLWPTGEDGGKVTIEPEGCTRYILFHLESQSHFNIYVYTEEHVRTLLELVAPLTNWNLPVAELIQQPGYPTAQQLRAILKQAIGDDELIPLRSVGRRKKRVRA